MIAVALSTFYLKLVTFTSRIRIQVAKDFAEQSTAKRAIAIFQEKRPAIFTFWHSDVLCLLHFLGSRGFTMMLTTQSRKDPLAQIAPRFGLRVSLGLLEGGGRHALVELLDRLKLGSQVCLSADGTIGERKQCKASPLILAQESGCPIVPISAHARFSFRIRSKEAVLSVPLPFNHITITLGPTLEVTKHHRFNELEDVKKTLKTALDRLNTWP